MKFHFVNVVWGQDYTDLFVRFSLPTQLSSGNLPAYQKMAGSVYKIYTTKRDAEYIVNSPIYSILSQTIPTKIKTFKEGLENDKYGLMNECNQHAIIEANKEDAIVIWLTPDTLWADGSFARLIEIAETGKRVVMVAGYRTVKETFLPVLKQEYFKNQDFPVSISHRELVKISLEHLHPSTPGYSSLWDSPNYTIHPSQISWKVSSQGLLIRAFHIHPLMIYPFNKKVLPVDTVDADYISRIVEDFDKDIYVVEDSDEIFLCEISNALDCRHLIKQNHKANIDEICNWMQESVRPHHLWVFKNKQIKFHSQDISPDWDKVESQSNQIVIDIINRFSSLDAENGNIVFQSAMSEAYTVATNGEREEALKIFQRATEVRQRFARDHQLADLAIIFLGSSFTQAIGHISFLDLYIKMNILGWGEPYRPVLLAYPDKVANPCYLKYWSSYITVIYDPWLLSSLEHIAKQFQEISGNVVVCKEKVMWFYEAIPEVQKRWEEEGRSPLLKLSPSDYEQGWFYLEKMEIPKNSWFVCVHAREEGFWKSQVGVNQNHRNVNIETYYLAIETIVERGGWVIRMGDSSMKPLPKMAGVVDYAHSEFKSDWMDVFLCASCRFFLGSTSGLYLVSSTFGVPCVCTNFTPIAARPFSTKDLFIPKLLWSKDQERYLTFTEAWSPPFGHFYEESLLVDKGVKIVDNTSEEVNDLVLEMLERLDGVSKYTLEDHKLQEQYNNLGVTYGSYGFNSRVGQEFLRKYAKLLPSL